VAIGDDILNTTDDGVKEEIFGIENIVTMFHYKTYLSYLNDVGRFTCHIT